MSWHWVRLLGLLGNFGLRLDGPVEFQALAWSRRLVDHTGAIGFCAEHDAFPRCCWCANLPGRYNLYSSPDDAPVINP